MGQRRILRNLHVAALALALSTAVQPQQLPANGRIVAGSGSIAQAGSTMTVTQTSPRLIADWQSFSIGNQASVVFNQPNASAVALNRVTGTTPSMIDGALRANGQVFLLNPNGVLFGNGARVDVGALVASTLQLSNADFLNGNYRFSAGPSAGAISNAGGINAPGGIVALIAPSVSNSGRITADKGSVALAAGNAVNIDFVGDGLVNIKVERGAIDALVENKGLIQADGGRVVMTTQAAQDILNNVVNNEGVVQARMLENREGRILLLAGSSLGEAKAGGTFDVSASAGQGGKIQVFGEKVAVEEGARLDATGAQGGGEILIGGGWQGSGGYPQATRTFVARDAVLDASATINGNGGSIVAWSDVNNPLSQTRVFGNLLAKAGANGGDGGRIETSGHWLDVAGIRANASTVKGKGGEWLLDPNNITIQTGGPDTNVAGSPNFTSTDDSSILDTGTIEALLNGGTSVTVTTASAATNSQVGNITVSGSITSNNSTADATLTLRAHNDIIIQDASISEIGTKKLNIVLNSDSDTLTGGRVFINSTGPPPVTLSSNGGNIVMGGGVCGTTSCTAPAIGSGAGLAGILLQVSGPGGVSLTSSGGDIWLSGRGDAGGGPGIDGPLSSMDSGPGGAVSLTGVGTGVSGAMNVSNVTAGSGGLTLTGSASSATPGIVAQGLNVTGSTTVNAAGLDVILGDPTSSFTGSVSVSNANTVSIAAVSAMTLGAINAAGTITAYTDSGDLTLSGNVSTTDTTANAIMLIAGASIANAAPAPGGGDIQLSGSPTITVGGGGTATLYTGSIAGSTAAATLISAGNFRYASDVNNAPNFTAPIGSGTYLIYREQPAVSITAGNAGKTYDGLAYSGNNGVSYSGFVNGDTSSSLGSALNYGGTSQGAVNAGNYTITPSGLTDSLGYALSFANGTLTVNKASLTVSANSGTKNYDGSAFSGGFGAGYSGLVNGEGTGVLGGSLNYGGLAQGAVNPGSFALSLSGLSAANYNIGYTDGSLTINPATLTIGANSVSKTYDGLAYTGSNSVNYGGFVGSDGPGVLSGSLSYGGTWQSAVNAGSYTIAPSGLSSSKYNISYTNGILNIAPAPLTITASDFTKKYDGTAYLGGNGVTYSGFVHNETPSVLSGAPSYGGSSQNAKNAGSYAITPGGLSSTNYAIKFVDGKLTIDKVPLTVTASDVSKSYGQTASPSGFTQSGLVNGDKIDTVVETSLGTDAKAGVANGPYKITPSAAAGAAFDANNYNITYIDGKLTVTPVALTVTASDISKVYGQTASLTGFSPNGLVNGDKIDTVVETSLGTDAKAGVAGGPYAITPSAAAGTAFDARNYSIVYVNGKLTVMPAVLTVTASDISKTYGQTVSLTGFTQSGLANGDWIDTLVLTSAGTDAKAGVAGGPYAITPSAAAGTAFDVRNYSIAYVNGKLTLTPAALTVTALDATKKYDGLPYGGGSGVTFSGFVNNEDSSALTGTLSYGGNAQRSTNAGSYAITPGGWSSNNYTIKFVDGKLTVDQVPLTVTANNASKTEDGAAFSGGNDVTYNGFVNSETPSVLGGTLSYGGFSQGARAAGSYAITPYGLTSSNYVISYVDGILTINPPPPIYTSNTVTTSNSPPVTGSSGLMQLAQLKLVVEVLQPPTTVPPPAAPDPSPPASPPASQLPTQTQQVSLPPPRQPGTTQQLSSPATPVLGKSPTGTGQPPGTTPKQQPAARSVAATTEPKEPVGTVTQEPPPTESVKALARSVADATGSGAALETLTSSEVDLAIAGGMPPAQARAAGEVFKMAVVLQLSNGVPPAVAMARAAAIFKIEASFPKSPPQVTTARSFAASFNSQSAASNMKNLAGTSTGSGSTAFDQRLSNVLRAGANFADAVSRAQAAGQIMDNLAKADATPRGTLTGGSSRPLASMSEPQQKALGNLLALGIPHDQASRIATSVGAANTAAILADARSPMVGMATGNFAAVKSGNAQPAFDKALAAAMLGGMPMQASIERAQRIESELQRLAGADRNNPLSSLASGTSTPQNVNSNEDRALAQALLTGKTPAEAQAMMKKIAEILAPEKPSALTSLASGRSIETLLSSPGNSRTYRQVLSKALERNMPLDQAVNMARRAEAENAVRVSLPQSVADMVKRNPATVAVASEQGAALPSWLKFDAKTNTVVAYDPPPGALPVKVRITAGNQQAVIQVSEARQ